MAMNTHVTFVVDESANAAAEMLRAKGMSTAIAGTEVTGNWCGSLLDGYEILNEEVSHWRSVAPPIVVIDDFLNPPVGATLVINSAPHAKALRSLELALLGPGTLVSPEFAALPNRDRSVAPERVLVSFGRLDPQNLTGRIIEVFAPMLGWPHLTVVMSGQSEYLEQNRAKLAAMSERATLVIDAPNLVGLMSDADIAIGAGGVSMLERFSAGVPSITATIIDNQREYVCGGVRLGATIEPQFDLNDVTAWRNLIGDMISDGSERVRLAARGRALIDGKGPQRVAKALIARENTAHS